MIVGAAKPSRKMSSSASCGAGQKNAQPFESAWCMLAVVVVGGWVWWVGGGGVGRWRKERGLLVHVDTKVNGGANCPT